MSCILVTGFEPFGGEPVNPSAELLALLPKELAGAKVVTAQLPCTFSTSHHVLSRLIRETAPDLVVCIGQAGGRQGITAERAAINIQDARIADNLGAQPVDVPVVEGGPAAYFSTLPIKAITEAVRKAGIPASVSNSTGTYVCNHIMYSLLHFLHLQHPRNGNPGGRAVRGGFIHIPYLTRQVLDKPGNPSLSLDQIVKGITAALEAAIIHKEDLTLPGGSVC